ncbi:MAG: helix-turn-helix domain-containing protein, partial [Minisyncoccia bacterium]
MSDEIYFEGVRYISAREAALFANVTRDYVARLARNGKIKGKRIGKNWYVEDTSLRTFLVDQESIQAKRNAELMHNRKREYKKAAKTGVEDISSTIPQKPIAAMWRTNTADEKLNVVRSMRSTVEKLLTESGKTVSPHTRVSPLYAAHPTFDFVHKISALITAFVLVFGIYAYVHPDTARFVMDSARNAIVHVGTGGGQSDQLAAATEPGIVGRIADLFRGWFGGKRGEVYLSFEPYTAPTPMTQKSKSPSITLETPRVTNVTHPIIQHTIEPRTITSGLTRAELEARLAALAWDLRQSLMFSSNTTYRQDDILSDSFGDALGGTLEDLTIVDSSWTGGTITNATITGGSITGVSVSATSLTGIVPVANGGTGTSTYATGDILYADAADSLARLPIGANNRVLKVVGGVPTWSVETGGGGGDGVWATTTDDLAIYPEDFTDVVIIGDDATSTTGNIFEVDGNSLFGGSVIVQGGATSKTLGLTGLTSALL